MSNDKMREALKKAFQFGQNYWRYADSEMISHHKKSEKIKGDFDAFVEETATALTQQPESEPVDVEFLIDIFDTAASRQPNKLGAGVIAVADAVRRESPQPTPQVPDVDDLAQFILEINGSNEMGAGALAQSVVDWLESRQ